jgi:hypothetical protein
MITVFDDFIKDEQLLQDIANDSTLWDQTGNYTYWKGWWNSPAKNTAQRLTEYIWGTNFPLNMSFNADGFEYWTGIQTALEDGRRDYLELHYDDDVNYRKETGNRMFPIIGCVYYPIGSEFEGGDLAIYTDGEENSPELIKTRPNRLVIFEPGKVVHGVHTVTEGVRRAIAINAWGEEPWSVGKGFIKLDE